MILAIDGPVGSGKSAVGRRVAEAIGLPFVDSGLMYRAVGCLAMERGVALDDADRLTCLAGSVSIRIDGRSVHVDGEDYTGRVYQPELSEAASQVGQVAGVRLAVVAQLRALGRGGVVMAGRDIGTVVFPDADHKVFLTASAGERARRRATQMAARGEPADPERLRIEVEERDRRDAGRAVAPMRAAEDALVLETDGMSLEEVVTEVLRRIDGQPPAGGSPALPQTLLHSLGEVARGPRRGGPEGALGEVAPPGPGGGPGGGGPGDEEDLCTPS